ncbi:hypothetical protein GE107_15130 [Cohnella sp. CFH 77786]|uniref:PKD domain-containing protein n=1 Tax=Cohnella sp. CFH 77786 TaxID=2662265 RepID=UPI001C6087B6|nr:PKD domain-containing protein [Cohnella sp. CFH 77786]MBW5447389.1 hypothetical protein [Cohnella sp. CFH 77786]
MKKILTILNIISLIVLTFGGSFLFGSASAEGTTPAGVKVVPTYENNTNDDMVGDYTVSDQSTKTVTFNTGTVSGKVIKNLMWYDENGQPIRVASGDWLNKTSYSGTDTIRGTQIKVKADGGTPYGGIYYWSRSGGSNVWKSSSPDVEIEWTSSEGCPSAPDDEWGLKAYPNCTDHHLPLTLVKKTNYVIQNDPRFINISIEDKSVVQSSIKPVDVQPDLKTPVDNAIYGGSGTSDSSTKYTGEFKTISKSSIRIYYQQTFGVESLGYCANSNICTRYKTRLYFHDFTNPGARQIWYYVAFTFAFEGYTYLYNDKQLYVEWGDPDPTPTGSPSPSSSPVLNVTGDFDILPSSTINWRDSFTLKPRDFVIPSACRYQSHQYLFQKDGYLWTSEKITSQTSSTTYSYSSYPAILGVGDNHISIKVVADCAESGWVAEKVLTINSPGDNQPPNFSAGFFKEYNRTGTMPDDEVAVGTRVNLRVFNAEDPDGDAISYTWLFSSSNSVWIRNLPTEYGAWEHDEAFYNLAANELGVHNVKVIARDAFGAESSRTVSLRIIPENPIPIIDGPAEVKENRPLPAPFDGSRSYSPMGRQITQYIWNNKKDKYTVPGTETIKLDVVDSAGLKSLSPAVANLTVIPDDPPIAVIEMEQLGIRSQSLHIVNKSNSPDGDKIVSARYRFRYDKDNNGFADDTWGSLLGDLAKGTMTPTKVGKYQIELTVTEDYGKTGTTTTVVDVVNLAPTVSFVVEGKNEQPVLENQVKASEIVKSWPLYNVNSTTAITNKPYMWSVDGDKLVAGLGKGMERQYSYPGSIYLGPGANDAQLAMPPLSDNGYGPNGLTAYRSLTSRDPGKSQPLLIPYKNGKIVTEPNSNDYDTLTPVVFDGYNSVLLRSNKTYIYFKNGDYLFALNKSKIGRYKSDTVMKVDHSGYYPKMDSYLTHDWLDGNPYDFVINLKDTPAPDIMLPFYYESDLKDNYDKIQKGDYSGARYTRVYDEKPFAVEVSGSRIYLLYIKRDYMYEYKTSSGGSDHWEIGYANGGPGYKQYVDIQVFDAYAGRYLSSSYKLGERIEMPGYGGWDFTVEGDHLVAFPKLTGTAYKFDRQGKLVMKKEIPYPSRSVTYAPKSRMWNGAIVQGDPIALTCTPNPTYAFWKDEESNYYKYVNIVCYNSNGGGDVIIDNTINPDSPDGLKLFQFKPDFSKGIEGRLTGTETGTRSTGMYDLNMEINPVLAINPITNQAIARSTTPTGSGWGSYEYGDVIDLKTGNSVPWSKTTPKASNDSFNPGFYIKHDGTYGDGWASNTASNSLDKFNWHQNEMVQQYRWVNYYSGGYDRKANYFRFGEYFGDGVYLSIYDIHNFDFVSGQFSQAYELASGYAFLDVGTVGPSVLNGFRLGQYVSPDMLGNSSYQFTMSMDAPNEDTSLAGFSFLMADPKNRYAVETDGDTLYVSKYMNGGRTTLASKAFPFQPRQDYPFRIEVKDARIQVFVNQVPYFDVTDSTFTSGKYGPFSDKSFVAFSGVESKEIKDNLDWLTSYAIWEGGSAQAEVRYKDILFEDPENDPRAGDNQWTIQHTPKFLNNQGLSARNGKTFTSPMLTFDAVGNYRITLKAQDDPNASYPYPSSVFAEYRKWSNEYWRIITVHRRPVADYSLSINPTNNNVVWNERSYDPDRWISSSNYSTEATGIDYKTTRGIMERKYFYTTPSGVTVNQKLTAPREAGTYKVGEQVKDEYGAWSYWNQQTIEIVNPVVDEPPTPGFTLSRTTLYRGEQLTITSTAYDREDGPAANIAHEYYVNGTLASTSRSTWTHTFRTLGTMTIRQAVCDSTGQCAETSQSVTVLNRAPSADFDWSPKPVYEGDPVTLTNKSADPDGDALTYAWTITGPDGYASSGSAKDFAVPGSQTLNRPGTFRVALTVKDVFGASDTVTKNVIVRELGIQGAVLHTDAWEENRLRYNDKHPDASRPPDWFWAGEAFRLEASVTDTGGSATKPISVEAAASPELRMALAAADSALVRWQGLLRSKDAGTPLDQLPEGYYTFVFTVKFTNGAVKTDNVTIRLKGTVDQYVRVHRIQ